MNTKFFSAIYRVRLKLPSIVSKIAMRGVALLLAILLLPAVAKYGFVICKTLHLPGTGHSGWLKLAFADLILIGMIGGFWGILRGSVIKEREYLLGAALFVFLLICRFSLFMAPSVPAMIYQEFIKFLSTSCVVLFFLCADRWFHRERLLLILSVFLCLFGGLEALLGITQYTIQADVGLSWLGEKYLHIDRLGTAILNLSDGSKWIFDDLGWTQNRHHLILRSYGTFDYPNTFGGVLILTLLASCYLLQESGTLKTSFLKKKGLVMGSVVVQILALTTTFSRTAWMGASLSIPLLLLFGLIRHWPRKKEIWNCLCPAVIALSLGISLSLLFFHRQIVERSWVVTQTCQEGMTQGLSLDTGRQLFLKIARRMAEDRPWCGIGFRNFVYQMENFCDLPSESYDHLPVHNIYWLVLAETGWPGLVALLFLLGSLFFLGLKSCLLKEGGIYMAALFAFCCIGFYDNYFLTMQTGRFLFFGTAGALVITTRGQS